MHLNLSLILASLLFPQQHPGDPFNPYYVGPNTPRLTTPMWVGEEGVEAVVILAVDDMTNNSAKYEQFLRPLLDRLKRLDGRAPVSIMANRVDPNDPQLQTWLKEGLSIECHTLTHPCPLLQKGDFQAAADDYQGCVDLISRIQGNTPVAFRMPCCDSINSVSPRFFAEILSHRSPDGHRLKIDSSVFCILTPDDPDLPRNLVFDPDGRERFRKYLPFKSFLNTIENYPYPYVIGGTCWEFPCIVPSDWEAQNIQKPNNPKTVEDLKAALDAIVIKQGVMNLVFHPHGWIKAEQLVELIDHAESRHGKRVKFLTFREAAKRLQTARPDALSHAAPPRDDGKRFVDLDEDSYDDLIVSNDDECIIALFDPVTRAHSRKVLDAKPGSPAALPKIASKGENRGFWVHSRHFWWQNEDTADLPDHVDQRSFVDLLKDVEPRAKSPAASLKSLRVRQGYTAELVAAEPLVQDPVAFDWDAKGRLWVVEMADYPLGEDGKGKPCGRVRVLEDTDDDGQYDSSTVFLDGLSYPNGVMCWRNGVLVSCAPDIFYAEDTDGDDVCDKREVLLTGFDRSNPQHRVNGFALGLDGWVYASDGQSESGVKSLKTGKTHAVRGRDLRFRPDTGELELCTGWGQFGRSRDDWGNWFANNNSVWAWHVPIDEESLRRNPYLALPTPIQVVDPDRQLFPVSPILARFNDLDNAGLATSACSPASYRDDLFGPWFENNLFVCEPVHNVVHRVVLDSDGATFRGHRAPGEEQSEFLASSDNWSRFVQVKTGPDGALWVADMYRAVIEHPEWIPDDWEAKIDLRAGHDKGRIYRVYPVESKPRPIQRLAGLSAPDLVGAMDSPNGPQRDMAMRLLLESRDKAAVLGLTNLAKRSRRPAVRLQALATLACLEALDDSLLVHALRDDHSEVRRWAAEHAGRRAAASKSVADGLLELLKDKNPRVALGLALGVGDWPTPDDDTVPSSALADVLRAHGDDPWVRAAALSSAPPHAAGLVTWLLADSNSPEVAASLLDPLLPLVFAEGAQRDRNVQLLLRVMTRSSGEFADYQLSGLAGLLEAAARQKLSLDGLIDKLPQDERQPTRQRIAAMTRTARERLEDTSLPQPRRLVTLRLLGRPELFDNETVSALRRALNMTLPPDLQRSVINTLANSDIERGPSLILEDWPGYGPATRNVVMEALRTRPSGVKALLDATKAGRIAATEINSSTRQSMLNHADARIRKAAVEVFGATNAARAPVVDRYRAEIGNQAGDASSGRRIFEKHCTTCHQFKGVGVDVGPNLATLTDRSPEAMVMAVLDPNRAFEPQFAEYAVALKDGRVLSGLIAFETDNSITLRQQEASDTVILRNEIDEMQSAGRSLMPEGLENELTPSDLSDVIAFLATGGPPPKAFDGNRPALVAPAADGTITLPAAAAEIYGSSLVFEPHYENLGYWSSADDRAAWTFETLQEGTYDVFINYACQSDVSGNHFEMRIGDARVEGIATSTGTWDNYRRKQRVGELTITKGRNRLEIVPKGDIRGALMDLRGVIMVPRNASPAGRN